MSILLMKPVAAKLETFSVVSQSSLVKAVISQISQTCHPKLLLNVILPRLVQILDVVPAVLTGILHGFPHSFQVNTGTIFHPGHDCFPPNT
jgi:hypothetical protein